MSISFPSFRATSAILLLLGCTASVAQTATPSARVRVDPANRQMVQVLSEGQWKTIGRFDDAGRFSAGESPEAYGANGRCTRGSNDTRAVQAFLDAIRDGGQGIMAGCYIVDAGVLTLSPSATAEMVSTGAFKTYAAPQISGISRIMASGRGVGPLLSIVNRTQTSGNGSFYGGGTLGNITFYDRTQGRTGGKSEPVSGLLLQGAFNWRIGQIIGQSLGGSALTLSARTVAGNPDAYGSGGNEFASVVCTNCGGPAADLGSLTDTGQRINFLASYGGGTTDTARANGGLVSGGQASRIGQMAVLRTRGWAAVYGQGRNYGNRQTAEALELHAPENGLWVGGLLNSAIRGRINFDDAGGGTIWPRTAIKIGGQGSSVRQVDIDLQIRMDPATSLADITRKGTLIDLSNDPNLVDVTIRLTMSGNPAAMPFGRDGKLLVPVEALVKNRATWAGVTVIINGQTIVTPRKG